MYRRKVMVTAAAVFAIGVGVRGAADLAARRLAAPEVRQRRSPWVPGTNSVMSAHEPSAFPLAPPPQLGRFDRRSDGRLEAP